MPPARFPAVSYQSRPAALTILQLGDTSLPAEQPEMVDEDLLKTLHHVLLEVRKPRPPCILSPHSPPP